MVRIQWIDRVSTTFITHLIEFIGTALSRWDISIINSFVIMWQVIIIVEFKLFKRVEMAGIIFPTLKWLIACVREKQVCFFVMNISNFIIYYRVRHTLGWIARSLRNSKKKCMAWRMGLEVMSSAHEIMQKACGFSFFFGARETDKMFDQIGKKGKLEALRPHLPTPFTEWCRRNLNSILLRAERKREWMITSQAHHQHCHRSGHLDRNEQRNRALVSN